MEGTFLRLFRRFGFAVLTAMVLVFSAFATDTTTATMETIATATVAQMTSVQQALLGLIQQILPVAAVVLGATMVVILGIRFFRRIVGA